MSTNQVRERLAPYRDSSERRRWSFTQNWPLDSSSLSIDELVDNGFYYTGRGDSVQCAYCGGIIRGWEGGDTVRGEHQKHFPNCSYLRHPFHYPRYRDESTRFQSFRDWPEQLRQQPRQLSKAGLFYVGKIILLFFTCIIYIWQLKKLSKIFMSL